MAEESVLGASTACQTSIRRGVQAYTQEPHKRADTAILLVPESQNELALQDPYHPALKLVTGMTAARLVSRTISVCWAPGHGPFRPRWSGYQTSCPPVMPCPRAGCDASRGLRVGGYDGVDGYAPPA